MLYTHTLFGRGSLRGLTISLAIMGGIALLSADNAMSQTIELDPENERSTSVSDLADISPRDWYFQALESLIENYGCIEGYPGSTFRGDRAMTRGEFAAALSSCLDSIKMQVREGVIVTSAHEAAIGELQEDFRSEMARLDDELDLVEQRLGILEQEAVNRRANPLGLAAASSRLQFQVSTGLFAASEPDELLLPDVDSGDDSDENNAFLPYQVRLNFDTSFLSGGRDRLRIVALGQEASQFSGDPVQLDFGGVSADDGIELGTVSYVFQAFERVTIQAGFNDISPSVNFTFRDPFPGLSNFSNAPTATHAAAGDASIGFRAQPIEGVDFFIGYGYGAVSSESSDFGDGFFAGESSHAVEFYFETDVPIIDRIAFFTAYSNSADGQAGTGGPFNEDFQAISGGLQAAFTRDISLVGWYARSFVDGDDDLDDWLVGITARELFIERDPGEGIRGDLIGVVVGSPDTFVARGFGENVSPFQVEVFYNFPVNRQITLTPGFYYLDYDDGRDIIVGGIETTFSF